MADPASTVEPVPLVLLPGLNNSASVWAPMAGHLPPGLVPLALDLPPLDDIDDLARALLTTLPERFVLAGVSFGGYVAVAMLAADPARLRGLALVNSSAAADSPAAAQARLTAAQEVRDGDYEQIAMARVEIAYHPDNVHDETLLAARRARLAEYGVQRYLAHLEACRTRPDRRDLLAATEVPVIMIAGDQDRVIPTERQREMAEAAGVPFRVISGAGHMLPVEQPQALAAELAAWCATLTATEEQR
jgi:pimeloyl-ACP methyl ester carboxylesterase